MAAHGRRPTAALPISSRTVQLLALTVTIAMLLGVELLGFLYLGSKQSPGAARSSLHQADDLANALQENRKDKDKDNGEDEGGGDGKGEDAAKKLAELERKMDEVISKGRIRPPATTQIQGAVAQLGL